MPRSPFCQRRAESLSLEMQVIGQNNDGLDGKWAGSAGRLEHLPKVVNVFGQ
jgi:hypothetical protein